MASIQTELKIGIAIKYAESYPFLVKEPYMFLLDPSVSREDKIRILDAAYQISGGVSDLVTYVLELPDEAVVPYLQKTTDIAKEFLSCISLLISDAQKLVEEAKERKFNTEVEEEELKRFSITIDSMSLISDLAGEILNVLETSYKNDKGTASIN